MIAGLKEDQNTRKNKTTMKKGIELIAEERTRQDEKLWGDAHDDNHEPGALAMAGACYIVFAKNQLQGKVLDDDYPPNAWPFDSKWWKPNMESPVRNLQKGAAMIAAEMDREQRAKSNAGKLDK